MYLIIIYWQTETNSFQLYESLKEFCKTYNRSPHRSWLGAYISSYMNFFLTLVACLMTLGRVIESFTIESYCVGASIAFEEVRDRTTINKMTPYLR